jgi:hypothetical protein
MNTFQIFTYDLFLNATCSTKHNPSQITVKDNKI